MDSTGQQNHRTVLSILLFLYVCIHLVAVAFLWSVILALAGEGYVVVLREFKTLTLLGMTLLVVAMPLLSGYALLRGRPWTREAVRLTSLAILIASIIVLRQISWPRLSTGRLVFGTLYGGASLALAIYGFWFVNRRLPVASRTKLMS
jgi:hypothetical protein